MNQTISTISRSRDSLCNLGAIVARSAPANHGKSSTLIHLVEQLAAHGKNHAYCENIHRFVQSRLPIDQPPKDIRVVIRYCDAYIYIATGGDDEKTVSENIDFFNNKPCDYYWADSEGNMQLRHEMPDMMMPRVCISACRSDTAAGFRLLEKRARNTYMENLMVVPKAKDHEPEAQGAIIKIVDSTLIER